MLHSFRETGEQAIGLSSVETSLGFQCVAAESPDANHQLSLAKRSRICLRPVRTRIEAG